MIDYEYLQNLRTPTEHDPLRIMFSACLTGRACGYDGNSYESPYPLIIKLTKTKNIRLVPFCPEDFVFGTPRDLSDIHGGNGFDVLDGKAMVISEHGEDWTRQMVNASEQMLKFARQNQVELAILMDISAACGPQVIYEGNRLAKDARHQKGPGVCAAQLMRNGIKVICQRDNRAMHILLAKVDKNHQIDPAAFDFHESDWYVNYFKD